jgi:hypothetical protein
MRDWLKTALAGLVVGSSVGALQVLAQESQ